MTQSNSNSPSGQASLPVPRVEVRPDGTRVEIYPDGSSIVHTPDGSWYWTDDCRPPPEPGEAPPVVLLPDAAICYDMDEVAPPLPEPPPPLLPGVLPGGKLWYVDEVLPNHTSPPAPAASQPTRSRQFDFGEDAEAKLLD